MDVLERPGLLDMAMIPTADVWDPIVHPNQTVPVKAFIAGLETCW